MKKNISALEEEIKFKRKKFEHEMLKVWLGLVFIALTAWLYFVFLKPQMENNHKSDIYDSLIKKTSTAYSEKINDSRYYDNRLAELNTIIDKLVYERDILLSQVSGDNISVDDDNIITSSIHVNPKRITQSQLEKKYTQPEIVQKIVALQEPSDKAADSFSAIKTNDIASVNNIAHKNITQTYYGLFLGTHRSVAKLRKEWERVKEIREISILNLNATSIKSPGNDDISQLVLGPLRNAQDAMALCRVLRKKKFECQFGNFPNS